MELHSTAASTIRQSSEHFFNASEYRVVFENASK